MNSKGISTLEYAFLILLILLVLIGLVQRVGEGTRDNLSKEEFSEAFEGANG